MHPAELGMILHRAVEAQVGRIPDLAAKPSWLQEVEAVHDVRVASRRLRIALDLADPERYPSWRKQRKRAKALTAALGATRELDVHLLRLAGIGPELTDQAGHAVLEHALETFERRRVKAGERMRRGVERACLEELSGLRAAKAFTETATSPELSKAVKGLLEPRLAGALQQARTRVQTEDPGSLHRLRIGVKKLRYAIEVLAPALPPEAALWLGRLRAFQAALGDHHDWITLETELWRLHGQLTERRRAALASGTLDLLGIVVEHRRMSFEALAAAAEPMDAARALEDLLLVQGGASA
jgi:CHAD domain-containing protein